MPKHKWWASHMVKCARAPRAASPAGDDMEMTCDDDAAPPEPPLTPTAAEEEEERGGAVPCLLLGLPKDVLLCVVRAYSCTTARNTPRAQAGAAHAALRVLLFIACIATPAAPRGPLPALRLTPRFGSCTYRPCAPYLARAGKLRAEDAARGCTRRS
jgi:hypothetical protein